MGLGQSLSKLDTLDSSLVCVEDGSFLTKAQIEPQEFLVLMSIFNLNFFSQKMLSKICFKKCWVNMTPAPTLGVIVESLIWKI